MALAQNPEIPWQDYKGGAIAKPEADAHLWELAPDARFAEFLPAVELARWEKISHPESRANFATSQGGLRVIVGAYLNLDPRKVRLERAPHGKPYVQGGPEFNLSHSGGRILAVFANMPVGFDVENGERRVRAEELSRRYFFAEEHERIRRQKPEEKAECFLRHWVCKESSVKLTGEGIYRGLKRARIRLSEVKEGESEGEIGGRRVFLHEFSPAKSFLAALATWQPCDVNCFFRI